MSHTTRITQTPAALAALTQHMLDNLLPAPLSIDTPAKDGELTLWLSHGDRQRWLDTLTLVDESAELTAGDCGRTFARMTDWVRLPDTGVMFRIRTSRLVSAVELAQVGSR